MPKLRATMNPTPAIPTRPARWPLVLPVLALLLLGAHFYRAGEWLFVGLAVAGLALLALRRPWVPTVLQLLLLAGAAEWLWTAAMLVQQRMALGMPWQRMALILGVVAGVTALAAAVMRLRGVRARYAGG